jgi:hypothetical protein
MWRLGVGWQICEPYRSQGIRYYSEAFAQVTLNSESSPEKERKDGSAQTDAFPNLAARAQVHTLHGLSSTFRDAPPVVACSIPLFWEELRYLPEIP